jgi:hypothetical protein
MHSSTNVSGKDHHVFPSGRAKSLQMDPRQCREIYCRLENRTSQGRLGPAPERRSRPETVRRLGARDQGSALVLILQGGVPESPSRRWTSPSGHPGSRSRAKRRGRPPLRARDLVRRVLNKAPGGGRPLFPPEDARNAPYLTPMPISRCEPSPRIRSQKKSWLGGVETSVSNRTTSLSSRSHLSRTLLSSSSGWIRVVETV